MQKAKTTAAAGMGVVLFALSLAQFIMTVDTTIMNVSVPTLVTDLNTTVTAVQAAITLYALVMASLMLVGGKLGEIYGRKKMFRVGLVIYGIGSLITALAPNIAVLILGWSILEGIGASLMMPAMMALISINFKGKQRVAALGVVAGVAGAAAALGPIIGGALSTYASWRYAFAGEVVIAIVTFVLTKRIIDAKVVDDQKLDVRGAVMVASGLAVFVLGILQAGTYGWIRAVQPFEIGGLSIAPFGLSIVPFVCGFGVLILWRFFAYERAQIKAGAPVLLKVGLLKMPVLRSSLSIILITQLVLGGALFVMPLFLQLVLGYSAMGSGVALLPISIALILFSIIAPRFAKRFGPISSVRLGQMSVLVGLVWLIATISNDTTLAALIVPFAFIGAGIGLLIPLVQTILLGSVNDRDSSQAAGLNYTYQQLGMSLGTAIIGSVLLFSLGNSVVAGLQSSANFDQAVIEQNSVQISSGVQFASNEQVAAALADTDLSEAQQEDILAINSDARIRALRVSIGAAALFVLLSLGASGRVKDALEAQNKKTAQIAA